MLAHTRSPRGRLHSRTAAGYGAPTSGLSTFILPKSSSTSSGSPKHASAPSLYPSESATHAPVVCLARESVRVPWCCGECWRVEDHTEAVQNPADGHARACTCCRQTFAGFCLRPRALEHLSSLPKPPLVWKIACPFNTSSTCRHRHHMDSRLSTLEVRIWAEHLATCSIVFLSELGAVRARFRPNPGIGHTSE